MAEGGEEKAAFVALKNDAQQALPKIAQKDAELVDTTVQKGAKSLADHAANEANLEADFKARMPPDPAPIHATPTQAADTAAADGTAAADAEATQAAVAAEEPVKPGRIQQALAPDEAGAADPAAVPQFDNSALRDLPNYNDDIDKALNGTGITREQYEQLRLTPTNDLTDEQIQQVATVRNQIKIGNGQMVTKVLHPNVVKKYFANLHEENGFDATRFGGSIARGSDTADLMTPAQLRDGLALDDGGKGWTPVGKDAAEAYQLRLQAPPDLGDASRVSYGYVGDIDKDPSLAVQGSKVATLATGRDTTGSVMETPFTGTGYTAGGVPEWLAPGTSLPGRAEIWKVTPDGQEQMVGYYDQGSWTEVK